MNFKAKRDEYIAKIEQMPYGDGVLVLPNGSLQREVKLHHMIECIGLDTLAEQIFNKVTNEDKKVIDHRVVELLVEKLLFEKQEELQYFKNIGTRPGVIRALANLFVELRGCNLISTSELGEIFNIWKENSVAGDKDFRLSLNTEKKNHDVQLLFEAYVDYLKNYSGPLVNGRKNKICDLEYCYFQSIKALSEGRIKLDKKYYLSDAPFLNQIERDFVASTNGAIVWEEMSDVNYKSALEQIANSTTKLRFRKFSNHKNELWYVLKDVKKLLEDDKKIKASDIGVVLMNMNCFSRARLMADRLHIPVIMPNMVMLAMQPIFSIVLKEMKEGYKTIIEYVEDIRKMLSERHLEQEYGEEYRNGTITMDELRTSLLSYESLKTCLNTLTENCVFCGLQTTKYSFSEFKKMLSDLANTTKITTENGMDTGVVLTSFANALGREYKYLFLLGMNEGEFPIPARENWIYNDDERRVLRAAGLYLSNRNCKSGQNKGYLEISTDKSVEGLSNFCALLQSGAEIVLSWAEENSPCQSSYVDDLLLAKYGKEYNLDKPGEEKISKSDGLMKYQERWERLLNDSTIVQDLRDEQYDEEMVEDLADGWDVDFLRSKGNAKYLGDIDRMIIPQSNVLSITKVEEFVKCPFKYLADNIWQIEPDEEETDDFPPLVEGNIIHKTMELYVRRYIDKYHTENGRAKLYSEIGSSEIEVKIELKQLFDGCFADACSEMEEKEFVNQNDFTKIQKQQVNRIRFLLDKFFDEEFSLQWKEKQYRYFMTEEAVYSDILEQGLPEINGRIDRIDVIYEEDKITALRIIDYKKSNVPAVKADMQIGFYQFALPLKFDGDFNTDNIKITGYYYKVKDTKMSDRTFSTRYNKLTGEQYCVKLRTNVNNLCNGKFNVGECNSCISFCPYIGICRKNIVIKEDENE